MKKLLLALIAAVTLGMGVATAAPASGLLNSLTNNHPPSAPYTYSEAGG